MAYLARLATWLLLALVLCLPASAREEIRNFASDINLHVDGSVQVIETVDVVAEGIDIRRGIYRDIPTVMLSASGNKIRSDLDVQTVTRDGQPEPFRTERMGNFVRIWIGDSDSFIARGKHRYAITYSMTRMARSFDDHDELYWNATGNYWIFPIVNSVAHVTLPPGAVISDLVGYTGAVGSTEQAVTITRNSDSTATLRTNRELGAGEGMSFAVKFQKGILTLPTGLDAWLIWLSDLREIVLPILGIVLVLAYNLIAWNRVGRDPPKGTIIPLFHPPKDFSPALTHYVHKWGFEKSGWTALTASIFDLGVKGLVKIDNPKKTLSVTTTGKEPDAALPVGEQLLFSYFQSKGEVTVDKQAGPELEKKRGEFVAAIESENRSVWFRHNTNYAVLGFVIAIAALAALVLFDVLEPLWLFVGVVSGILLGVFGTVASTLWKGGGFRKFFVLFWIVVVGFNIFAGGLETFSRLSVNTAALAALSIVLTTVVFAVLMRAPTIQGRKVMDQIDGFKLYLETAEKNRLNINDEPAMSVDRFERILPYAIALGVEKPWSEHFEAELARNAVSGVSGGSGFYSPLWYSGGSTFSSGKISNAISAAATGMSAAMVAAQPVQASSSGFSSGGGGGGGGFSGGGGGGGGGGGW